MARFYIGNLPQESSEVELQAWLEEKGFRVESVQIIRDLETSGSRGFGFAELPEVVKTKEAVERLNNQQMEGNSLRVSEARPVNLNMDAKSPRKKAS